MSIGAERAQALPQSGEGWNEEAERLDEGLAESFAAAEDDAPESAGRSTGAKILAAFLILAGLAWLAAVAMALFEARPQPSFAAATAWLATLSAPLILIFLVWMLFGRTGRRETERFTRAVGAMRAESHGLEAALAMVAARLEENRARVGEEAERLMSLGEEASDRLGRVTHYLARETAEMDRKAQALEGAAANARIDIGVLMSDLPRAEEQARSVAEAMKQAGLTAHEQAGTLESQLTALAARGREADEIAGGAAQRLNANIARIESGTQAAAERMDAAAARLNTAVDESMARAAESVERTRGGLTTQSEAMLAMIEQGRAAFEQAGAETSRILAERLGDVGGTIERLAERIAAQEEATRSLIGALGSEIAEVEQRVSALARSGDDTHGQLSQAIGTIGALVGELQAKVDHGRGQAGALIDQAHDMAGAIEMVTAKLRDELAPTLGDVETRAARTGEAALAVVPSVEAVQSAAVIAADSLAESEAAVGRQREALDALLGTARDGVGEAEQRLRALGEAIAEADGVAARMVQQTGPELVEALVRVREAANQAAAHAREAIAAVIPQSAEALGDASREALVEAIADPVREQMSELSIMSEHAVSSARAATARLTRQLLTLGETAAAIEARIAEERRLREEEDGEQMSRRVSLLVEALNSTAIDVTKLLSNEVTDSEWNAYLKGDRGIFTRRAVRLLDSGEAREVLRHYEEEPEFREQVNRYVHDFEAMLRRVLADRDGHALGVTLLSSDMGKLYVALAQAIDRLRR